MRRGVDPYGAVVAGWHRYIADLDRSDAGMFAERADAACARGFDDVGARVLRNSQHFECESGLQFAPAGGKQRHPASTAVMLKQAPEPSAPARGPFEPRR